MKKTNQNKSSNRNQDTIRSPRNVKTPPGLMALNNPEGFQTSEQQIISPQATRMPLQVRLASLKIANQRSNASSHDRVSTRIPDEPFELFNFFPSQSATQNVNLSKKLAPRYTFRNDFYQALGIPPFPGISQLGSPPISRLQTAQNTATIAATRQKKSANPRKTVTAINSYNDFKSISKSVRQIQKQGKSATIIAPRARPIEHNFATFNLPKERFQVISRSQSAPSFTPSAQGAFYAFTQPKQPRTNQNTGDAQHQGKIKKNKKRYFSLMRR